MSLASAYRDEMAEQMLLRSQERSAFIDALLGGRITDTATLWEAADLLGLPYEGVFAVVAGEVPALARHALPEIENRLRDRAIGSAWRLLPDVQIGVVSLRSEAAVELLLSTVRGVLTERVGVSPVYGRLDETPWALHLARVAMASALRGRPEVRLFDDDPLPALVVSAPTTAYRITRVVLGRLLEMPHDEQEMLLDTLSTFFAAGGEINEVARRLYCHRNTVRHRLRRIEQKTGRSMDDPRATAELCIALEGLRRLPDDRSDRQPWTLRSEVGAADSGSVWG
jgi:sugar diacid utilization regulator